MKVSCTVSSLKPLSVALDPDLPLYEECDLSIEYTDVLLRDLGPHLLNLYASLAGPPVTRAALVEMVQPVVHCHLPPAGREEILDLVRQAYTPILTRGLERVLALGQSD